MSYLLEELVLISLAKQHGKNRFINDVTTLENLGEDLGDLLTLLDQEPDTTRSIRPADLAFLSEFFPLEYELDSLLLKFHDLGLVDTVKDGTDDLIISEDGWCVLEELALQPCYQVLFDRFTILDQIRLFSGPEPTGRAITSTKRPHDEKKVEKKE